MLLPDDLIIRKNCSKEMIKLHKKTNGSIIATKKVERKTVPRWGILSIKKEGNLLDKLIGYSYFILRIPYYLILLALKKREKDRIS